VEHDSVLYPIPQRNVVTSSSGSLYNHSLNRRPYSSPKGGSPKGGSPKSGGASPKAADAEPDSSDGGGFGWKKGAKPVKVVKDIEQVKLEEKAEAMVARIVHLGGDSTLI
jgi:hypothetical protein